MQQPETSLSGIGKGSETISPPRAEVTKRLRLTFSSEMGAFVALIVISLALTFLNEYFLTVSNIVNVFRQVAVVAIAAVGQTFVIVSGGIDLSAGSVISLTGTLVAGFMYNFHMSSIMAIPLTLLIGVGLGLINVILICLAKIPPIIATLATMIAYQGAALTYTNGYAIPLIRMFGTLGRGYVGPIPVPVLVMALTYILAFIVLRFTVFGRITYGLGGNEEAVKLSGIPVSKYRLTLYATSGLTAALAGIVLASRLSSGQPIAGQGMELDTIAAAVLGGTSIFGGVGSIWGTFVGAMIIIVINNGLNLMNASPYSQLIAKGAILAFAVSVNSLRGIRFK